MTPAHAVVMLSECLDRVLAERRPPRQFEDYLVVTLPERRHRELIRQESAQALALAKSVGVAVPGRAQ
jgi:hypothetical protein